MSARKGTGKRSPEQNRKIWALASELGLDEGLLRDLVERLTGQRKTSVLTSKQAIGLIDEMNRLGGKTPTTSINRTTSTNRIGMATPEQISKIRSLERQLGWTNNPKRLHAFMKKYGGIERLEWLRFRQAQKLIEGLKGVKSSLERQQEQG